MSDVFLLSKAQMARISPHFPLSHGVPRVDDRRVVSGIIYVIRNGLQWKDAPKAYGPHKTLYNRFIRWSRLGVFDRIFAAYDKGDYMPPRGDEVAAALGLDARMTGLLLRGVELEAAMRYDDMNALETRFLDASHALRLHRLQYYRPAPSPLTHRCQIGDRPSGRYAHGQHPHPPGSRPPQPL